MGAQADAHPAGRRSSAVRSSGPASSVDGAATKLARSEPAAALVSPVMLSGPYQRLRCWVNSGSEYSVPTSRPRSAAVVPDVATSCPSWRCAGATLPAARRRLKREPSAAVQARSSAVAATVVACRRTAPGSAV